MAEGIILAAGMSTRAHANKLLFEIHGISLIEHAIKQMKPFVSHIYVITGHYQEELNEKLMDQENVSCMHNADYERGMFSSIQTGVFATREDFFILPGDCPMVSHHTFKALLDGIELIRVPSYHHKRGHPIFFTHALKEALLEEPASSNLKLFRNRYPFETIEVDDPHILDDIDTLSDFNQLMTEENT